MTRKGELNMRHPLSARFHVILEELGRLHDQKQADYGQPSDPFANIRSSLVWGVQPWVGAMVRLTDKVKRLQRAALGGILVNESVIDSFNDIAVYAVIARCLYEQSQQPAEESSSSGPESPSVTSKPGGPSAPTAKAWDMPRGS